MKQILNYLAAAALCLIALGSCQKPVETDPTTDNTVVFEIEDIDAIPASAGTFSLNVKTNRVFTVEVPSDIAWLRYVETKSAEAVAEASTKAVVFEVDKNEEDAMRQARVKFLASDGSELKTFTIIQKAGGGIEFEIEKPEDVPVEGASITLAVTCNVPFTAAPAEGIDWITVTGTATASVTLQVASNGSIEARDGVVNFYREGTENLIGYVELHQMEPNVILAGNGYSTIAEAMEAYNALPASDAVEMILAKGTHAGHIAVAEGKAPLTISGNGVATLDGAVEVDRVAVTVKDLTIACSTEGSLPQITSAYNYPFGIMVHSAGYGVRIENVRIDMSNLHSDATGIFLLGENTGTSMDYVRNSTIDGGASGHRLMQIYGGVATITGNTFANPYSSYAIRIGNSGNDLLLSSNTFNGNSGCGVHFYSLKSSKITLGNGTKDTNKFADTITTPYKADSDVTSEGNSFAPVVTYADGIVSVYIDPDAPATLSRVWGYYDGSYGTWDDDICKGSNWDRNGIISGNYVYVTLCGNTDETYGVAVFDLYTGEYIRTITQGFTKEGRFWTAGIVRLDGYEDDVIYVSNMAMGSSGQDLVIYRLVEPDSEGIPTKAEEAHRYTVPEGERYGDKMTSYGSDEDGLLLFVSFYKLETETYRHQIEFKLTAGVIEDDLHNQSAALVGRTGAVTGGIYIFIAQGTGDGATRQALYATNSEIRFVVGWWYSKPDMWYNVLTDTSHSWSEDPGSVLTGVGYYDSCALDPRLFFSDGVRYLAYTVVEQDSEGYASGYLRVVRCPDADGTSLYPLFNIFYAVKDDASAFQRYPIGDPDDFGAVGYESTNKTGFCDVAYRGDDIYILSGVTSTGISLFKVD